MRPKIAIVGAGLFGRVLACQLDSSGYAVSLFDKGERSGVKSAAFAGAGMLSPYCELENSSPLVFALGRSSPRQWENLLKGLDNSVFLQTQGSLAVAHGVDLPLLERMHRRIVNQLTKSDLQGTVNVISRERLAQLEPALFGRFQQGIYFPEEGQIDNRQLLTALMAELTRRTSIECRFTTEVTRVAPHRIKLKSGSIANRFDRVIDCRGLGAIKDIKQLRGVRGEIIEVHAPGVELNRPVRLMHPRYPLYVVPRQHHRFLIGATSLESDDMRPLTVQSALELLSAAFAVHPSFGDASIIEMRVNCRPALSDNQPRIYHRDGLIRVNGLYRHGFLITPALSDLVCRFLNDGHCRNIPTEFQTLFEEDDYQCESQSTVTIPISKTILPSESCYSI